MEIKVSNLGAIREGTFDFAKRFSVFCGPNGTGKTKRVLVIAKGAAAEAAKAAEEEKARQYAEQKAKQKAAQESTTAEPSKNNKVATEKSRYSPEEAAKLLPKVELSIREQEAMMKVLEMQMNDPANHADPERSAAMAEEHLQYETKIAELMEKWELLMEAAEG